MAATAPLAAAPTAADAPSRPRQRGPPLNQIYALPAPIRTFPLPSFYPNNPVSVLHLVYSWVKQVVSPPPAEPSIVHTGIWDPNSRSVHITDHAAIRAFWEQGFYGKGNLSRSEPNWLKREQIRRGAVAGDVSEQRTAQRREERRQVKWERARTEQEALERTRREEALLSSNGGTNVEAVSTPGDAPGPDDGPELSTAKAEESLKLSDEATLSPAAHVEVAAVGAIDVTPMVVPPPCSSKDPEASLDGVADEEDAQQAPPAQPEPIPALEEAHDIQAVAPGVSRVVVSKLPVILEAPLFWKAPIGPIELLALPNCAPSVRPSSGSPLAVETARQPHQPAVLSKAPVGPLELLALPNSALQLSFRPAVAATAQHVAATDVVQAQIKITSTAPAHASTPGTASVQLALSTSPTGPLELLSLPNSLPSKQKQTVQPSGLDGVTVNGIKPAQVLRVRNGISNHTSVSKSPVGPLELLALPNTLSSLCSKTEGWASTDSVNGTQPAAGPLEESELDDADASIRSGNAQSEEDDAARDDSTLSQANGDLNGHANGSIFGEIPFGPVVSEAAGSKRTIPLPYGPLEQPPKRRRKSVRFSTTVESTTFLGRDPPSPGRSAVAKSNGTATAKAAVSAPREAGLILEDASAAMQDQVDEVPVPATSSEPDVPPIAPADIENKEHLQLSAEEAFFLSYGIGALSILDPETKKAVPREQLLALFRSHSYFPPREDLGPNDPFLVHYAVYHHFRSLGWVPRHGIKFGVDWMLYTRGPVFDHAEFGLIVLPAYSDAWWKENGVEAPRKSWHWLHGVNRVLSHVLKSLVLVYVDVPPPHVFDAAMAAGGISATLKEYKVREFMVRRWSSNRNR